MVQVSAASPKFFMKFLTFPFLLLDFVHKIEMTKTGSTLLIPKNVIFWEQEFYVFPRPQAINLV